MTFDRSVVTDSLIVDLYLSEDRLSTETETMTENRMSTPTLINLPPPPSDPVTPSDMGPYVPYHSFTCGGIFMNDGKWYTITD